MIDDEVKDDLDAACVAARNELVNIGHGPEWRMDVLVVGDVVSEIVLRAISMSRSAKWPGEEKGEADLL